MISGLIFLKYLYNYFDKKGLLILNDLIYKVSAAFILSLQLLILIPICMRNITRLFLIVLLLSLAACKQEPKTQKIDIFDFVLPQASYFFKINKPDLISRKMPVIVDNYLSANDKKYLDKLSFEIPFGINIFQNNSKLQGFVAIGKIAVADTLLNGSTYTYEGFNIYDEQFEKQQYFVVEVDGKYLVSNQKLLIENVLRQKEEWGKMNDNPVFQKGVNTLDNHADLNILVNLQVLKPDIYFESQFKMKPEDTGTWQFYDWVETQKPIASGISLAQDTLPVLARIFKEVKPVSHEFSTLIPFSSSEHISLSFDDFPVWVNALMKTGVYAPKKALSQQSVLSGLQAIVYFRENANKAVILKLESPEDFIEEETEKLTEFNNYDIYQNENKDLINDYFSNILPEIKPGYFVPAGSYVILTENQTYLEKILNDIQNHATLSDSKIYSDLMAEIPGAYHVVLFKNKISLKDGNYIKAQTYNIENQEVFVNLVLQSHAQKQGDILVEQVLSYPLKEVPNSDPQLVYNHKTKTYNIIFQDEENNLTLLDLKGKQLWKTKLKDKIIGKIKQVDLLRNHKLQYTFVTPHHWYVVDRLGRMVEDFPQRFMQKITRGISVFDYENNRKYRFGITQGKKFRLFDNQARKVKGFKVKVKDDILYPPQHFRVGSKDFIVMQDEEGRVYLLNRRGSVRIKVNTKFKTTRNRWGVYNRKFANIDDDDNLISIDLSGKIKQAPMEWGSGILSEIKHEVLAAVSDNKLLINKQLNTMDLGSYARPQVYKTRKNTFVFVADEDNNKVYAFNDKGQALDKFPLIGQKVLDFKADKSGKYLLVYDSAHNLIVYKF